MKPNKNRKNTNQEKNENYWCFKKLVLFAWKKSFLGISPSSPFPCLPRSSFLFPWLLTRLLALACSFVLLDWNIGYPIIVKVEVDFLDVSGITYPSSPWGCFNWKKVSFWLLNRMMRCNFIWFNVCWKGLFHWLVSIAQLQFATSSFVVDLLLSPAHVNSYAVIRNDISPLHNLPSTLNKSTFLLDSQYAWSSLFWGW